MRRACIECPEVYDGGLACPACGAPGEPLDAAGDAPPPGGLAYLCTAPSGASCVVWAGRRGEAVSIAHENGEGFDYWDFTDIRATRASDRDHEHRLSFENPGEAPQGKYSGHARRPGMSQREWSGSGGRRG